MERSQRRIRQHFLRRATCPAIFPACCAFQVFIFLGFFNFILSRPRLPEVVPNSCFAKPAPPNAVPDRRGRGSAAEVTSLVVNELNEATEQQLWRQQSVAGSVVVFVTAGMDHPPLQRPRQLELHPSPPPW